MNHSKYFALYKTILVCGCIGFLAACGGGGGSAPATLSADQAAYEGFALAPNATYSVRWSLPLSGPPVYGLSYLAASHLSLSASPLDNGTQKLVGSAISSLSDNLGLPSTASNPTRYLVNGQIVVGRGYGYVSYDGASIQLVGVAADGAANFVSTRRSNVSNVPLTGTVVAAPAELAHWFNVLYYNPTLLDPSSTWLPGAAYEKYTATQIGDSYVIFDYAGITTGSAPTPVATGTTIAALMAGGGIRSSSDQTTYSTANGSMTLVDGITTYLANDPLTNSATTMYQTYYELNGNVYVGYLIKNGTVLGGSSYPVASPGSPSGYTRNYSINYQIYLNAAAVASLQAAFTKTMTLPAGTNLTLKAGQTVYVPAGTVLTSPEYNVLTINGTNNTTNIGAGSVVNVPANATGPANNAIMTSP